MRSRKMITGAVGLVAVLALSGCAGGAGEGGGAVELSWSFWGNADTASQYQEVIDAFEAKNPDIKINPTYADWDPYWQKRSTEAAGGGLPDVMTFDVAYLAQFASRGALLDLGKYDEIDLSQFSDDALSTTSLDGVVYGAPTAANSWAMLYNADLLAEIGVSFPDAPYTWSEYQDFISEVTEKSGGAYYGGPDYAYRIQTLELQLRQEGENLFTDDGQLNFDEKRLTEFWSSTAALRDGGSVSPQNENDQIQPAFPISKPIAVSEMLWDNMGPLLESETAPNLEIAPPPTDHPDVPAGYLKTSSLISASAKTQHPEEAAAFIDFLVNSPEVAEILGTLSGVPLSAEQAASLADDPTGLVEYQESVADSMGAPPPPPVAGFGTIEASFLRLAEEIGLGTISVDDAVKTFFSEAEGTLNG
ncbi:ABC transporter substrate-binding protein [Microbacterium sp. CPCC 204701]|uniref:ABC transporter substrate-binding protein n=1 Tax=Microbacterium sp. CPCC 204701 TaxID=2493084 RepID=UPI0013E2E134|nr:extracellular solute-binding protein [Microbacterium sp. CPCC 204701]